MDTNEGQRERVRLAALYGEMGDGELLGLNATRSDLTDGAQAALAGEMKRRGLEETTASEQASADEADAGGDDWKTLHVFSQTFEARAAIGILEREEIEFAVEDRTIDERGDLRAGPSVQLALMVVGADWVRAVAVLRREAGLFPEAVVDPRGEDGEIAEEAMFVVGDFEDDADVAEAARVLQEAGIGYETTRHEDGAWRRTSVSVPAEDQERAIAVLERLLPEDGEE